MTFDSDHLLTSNTDKFLRGTTSPIYTLEQIEAAMTGTGNKTVGTGVTRAGGNRTTAAQKLAVIEAEKYEYFSSTVRLKTEQIQLVRGIVYF
jgi:hypothetical protein